MECAHTRCQHKNLYESHLGPGRIERCCADCGAEFKEDEFVRLLKHHGIRPDLKVIHHEALSWLHSRPWGKDVDEAGFLRALDQKVAKPKKGKR